MLTKRPRAFLAASIFPIASLPAFGNSCLNGDVPDSLLPNYIPSAEVQTSVNEWAPYRGYIYVADERSIELSLKFNKSAISAIARRQDFALEVDVVDFDSVLSTSWRFAHGFPSGVLVRKDVGASDSYHQLSLIVLRPHLLQSEQEYKVRFVLAEPITAGGRLKLNLDLSVSFPGSLVPPCPNIFFDYSDPTSPWNYFKLQTEQYTTFWYTPQTTAGVCWTNQTDSGFAQCRNLSSTTNSGDLALPPDLSGNTGVPGPGIESLAETLPTASLPDFITRRLWLTTPWGVETYRFGMSESFDTKAQSENIGDGPCLSTDLTQEIPGHVYLSRGYKEDVHSGDGAWRRIDSTNTHCSNLGPGQTHTETKNTVISQWITEPGIYNIVYCIDHPRDDHNNGGDHPEKHESNNCSTEAVFEVVAEPYVNLPNYDLTITSVAITTPQPVPQSGLMGARFSIRNIGDVTPPMATRSCYDINGPGTGGLWQSIASDQSDGGTLVPGVDQWEEILSLVPAPSVPGRYTLRVTANCTNGVPESDYSNNSLSIQFDVVPPRPNFVITAVGPAGGNYSIKAGSRFYPAMYIKNIGNANPTGGIRSAYYYKGPATGGAWVYITDDGTDAGQLCVGCQYREQYDGGMKIYVRGTYYIRGCADYQNAVLESNEADNCSVSAPITIY